MTGSSRDDQQDIANALAIRSMMLRISESCLLIRSMTDDQFKVQSLKVKTDTSVKNVKTFIKI